MTHEIALPAQEEHHQLASHDRAMDDEPQSGGVFNSLPFALIEKVIVDIPRVLLVVSYVGIVATLTTFIGYSLYHSGLYCLDIWRGDEAQATVGLLSGLDGIMIANGVYLIAAGSYIVYVKDKLDDVSFVKHSDRPQALRHLSPTTLKEKMAASLVGVSSVNLLQILVNVGLDVHSDLNVNWFTFTVKIGIHCILLIGLLVFARVSHMEESHTSGAHNA